MKTDRTKTRDQLIEELDKLRMATSQREAELTAANKQLEALNQQLIASELRFKALHNGSFGGIMIHDKGLILDCNQGLSDITGYENSELIGMDGLLLIAEESREKVMGNILSGYEKAYEAVGIRKNGTKYPLRLEARMIPYKGKHVRVVEFRDMTEIREKETELMKFATAVQQSPSIIMLTDTSGNIQYVNPVFSEITGFGVEECIGLNASLLHSEAQDDGTSKALWETISSGKVWRGEFLNKKKNGELYWEMASISPIFGDQGSITNYVKVAEDITDKTKSSQQIEAIYQAASMGIGITKDRIIRKCNPTFLTMLGYSEKELVGQSARVLYESDAEFQRVGEVKYALIANHGKGAVRTQFLKKDGTPVHVILSSAPFDSEDLSKGVVFTALDVTESDELKSQLQRSEEKYKALFENAPLAYQSLDIDGCILDINPQWLEILGYSRDEVIGQWFGNFLERASVEFFRNKFLLFKERGFVSGVEFKMLCKNGCFIDVSFEGRIGYDEHGEFRQTYCTFKEITAQKKAELERKKYQERLELALSIGSISICEWMLEDDTIQSDDRLAELLGFNDDPEYGNLNMIGRLKLLLHDEDQPFVEELNRLLKQPAGWLLDRSVRYRTSDGERCYWYRSIAKAVETDAEGKARRIIITHLNIDSEKRKDLEVLETRERVLHAEKMATLGTLTAGIAHEINNPNQMILSNAQFLGPFIVNLSENLKEFPEDVVEEFLMGIPIDDIPRRLRTSFANIQGGSQRIKTIVSELKDYVRQKDYDFSAVDLNRVIYSAQTLTSHLGKKMTNYFEWSAEPDLVVWGNFQKLEQVMVNLFVNAYEALNSKSQKVTISSFKDDENVVVKIADEGIGIPKEALGQITDPFFTTKQHQGGTGMGLSVVATVLREHEAEIRFEKNIPQGTCVFIKFPPCEA